MNLQLCFILCLHIFFLFFTVFELKCASQNYQWGKIGSESEVAKLLKNGDGSFIIDEKTPYAEVCYK